MARYRGNFTVAANYEPLKAAPFDARSLVGTKADLTAADTWTQKDGTMWIYSGMLVSVNADENMENNGVYVLTDAKNYQSEDSWRKLAGVDSIDALHERIDNLEVSGGDVEVETMADLPAVGDPNITYYVEDTHSIYRWDVETATYISYSSSPALDINIINGGNANGTN